MDFCMKRYVNINKKWLNLRFYGGVKLNKYIISEQYEAKIVDLK